MTTLPSPPSSGLSVESIESSNAPATATLDNPANAVVSAKVQGSGELSAEELSADDLCPSCGSGEPWGFSTACPNCGFYPALGQRVATECESNELQEIKFWEVVPIWAWVLGGGVMAIFFASMFANLVLPKPGTVRSLWAMAQCVIGASVAVFAHVLAFLFAVMKNDKYGPFDIILKPIDVWKPACQELPQRAWRLWMVSWGLTAAVCAILMIGGLRFSAIFDDWGVAKKSSVNILQAIVEQAREERDGGAESLEDAMNDFVGEAVPEDEEEETPHVFKSKSDCLIFGYYSINEGEPTTLLLASVVDHSLQYVGNVSTENLPERARKKLTKRLPRLTREKSFIKKARWFRRLSNDTFLMGQELTWLQPVLMCRVGFDEWSPHKREKEYKEPQFLEMLSDVEIED